MEDLLGQPGCEAAFGGLKVPWGADRAARKQPLWARPGGHCPEWAEEGAFLLGSLEGVGGLGGDREGVVSL